MDKYPGQNTEFFIIVNGATVGPIKGLKELFKYPFVFDTPVWYDGLPDWLPAYSAPLTAPLFADSAFVRMVMETDNVEPEEPDASRDVSAEEDEVPEIPELPELPEPESPQIPQGTPPPSMDIRHGENDRGYISDPPPVYDEEDTKPNSFLAWAIVVTLLCNVIAGIVAIVYACKVNSKFQRGDIAGAKRSSEYTQWWIAISITLGLIMIVANIFTGGLL